MISDEEMWARSNQYEDRILQLRDQLDGAVGRSNAWMEEAESYKAERNEALEKLEAARGVIAGFKQTSVAMAVAEMMDDPKRVVSVVALFFFELLDSAGAKNFVEWRLQNANKQEIILTAQRADGLKPEATRDQVNSRIARAVQILRTAEEEADAQEDAGYAASVLSNAARAVVSGLTEFLESQGAIDKLAKAFEREGRRAP